MSMCQIASETARFAALVESRPWTSDAHAHLGDAANAGHWFSPLNRTVPQTTLGNLAARATRYCGGRRDAMMGAPVERTSAG